MGLFFFCLFFALPFLYPVASYRYVSVRCGHLFLFSWVRRVDGVSRKNTNGVRLGIPLGWLWHGNKKWEVGDRMTFCNGFTLLCSLPCSFPPSTSVLLVFSGLATSFTLQHYLPVIASHQYSFFFSVRRERCVPIQWQLYLGRPFSNPFFCAWVLHDLFNTFQGTKR